MILDLEQRQLVKLVYSFLIAILFIFDAFADSANIAVASNFIIPMKVLVEQYESQSNHKIFISSGSSGKITSQIQYGAPYDLFYSADQTNPQYLIDKQLAVKGSQFTFAIGQLVLWSNSKARHPVSATTLKSLGKEKIAIANPTLAPYGKAAKHVLTRFNNISKDQIVEGENIGQTYHFVKSGAVKYGILAFSQLKGRHPESNFWRIPNNYYPSILQDAVILNKGRDNPVALAFFKFTQSESAQKTIKELGYNIFTSEAAL